MPTCRFLSGEASPKPRAFPFALFFSPFHCGCDVGRVTWWVPTASKSLSHQPSRIWNELNRARVGGEDWLKLICFSRTHTCPWFPDLTAVISPRRLRFDVVSQEAGTGSLTPTTWVAAKKLTAELRSRFTRIFRCLHVFGLTYLLYLLLSLYIYIYI